MLIATVRRAASLVDWVEVSVEELTFRDYVHFQPTGSVGDVVATPRGRIQGEV